MKPLVAEKNNAIDLDDLLIPVDVGSHDVVY